jgi:hypothetical protein
MGGNNKKKQISRAPAWQFYLGLFLGGGVAEGESDSAQVSEIISTEDLDSTFEEVESTISSSSNSGLHRRSRKLATMMPVDENSSLLSAAARESDKVQKVSEPKATAHSRMKHTQPASTPSHFQIRKNPLSSDAIFNQASPNSYFFFFWHFLFVLYHLLVYLWVPNMLLSSCSVSCIHILFV